MKRKQWQIWIELDENHDKIVFRGNEKDCRKYFKKNGGSKAGLHVGYLID